MFFYQLISPVALLVKRQLKRLDDISLHGGLNDMNITKAILTICSEARQCWEEDLKVFKRI